MPGTFKLSPSTVRRTTLGGVRHETRTRLAPPLTSIVAISKPLTLGPMTRTFAITVGIGIPKGRGVDEFTFERGLAGPVGQERFLLHAERDNDDVGCAVTVGGLDRPSVGVTVDAAYVDPEADRYPVLRRVVLEIGDPRVAGRELAVAER